MPTAPTPIPDLPVPIPITSDPSDFDARADATWIALPGVITGTGNAAQVTYENALEASDAASTASLAALTAVGATDYAATSASSLSLTAGTKAVHMVQAGKHFAAGDDLILIRRGDPNMRMYGTIDPGGWDGVDAATVTVASDGIVGSGGPYTDWMVVLAVFGTPGAKAADIRAGTSKYMSMTPGDTYDAFAEVGLTDASTIAVNMAAFINASVTLGGNRTLGNPTNPKPGQTGRIRFIQDGTGSRTLTMGSNWKRAGGATPLTTTAGAIDVLVYDVVSSSYILYDLIKSPS